MADYSLIENLLSCIGIFLAVYRLGSTDYHEELLAVERLRAAGKRSWPLLRRAAFRGSQPRARRAASLLHDMGDDQGLWALLDQLSNGVCTAKSRLAVRTALEQIGQQEIITSLMIALDRIDRGGLLNPSHWSLALCMNALKAIDTLGIRLSEDQWIRLLTLHVNSMDDVRVCRQFTPVLPNRLSVGDLETAPRQWPAGIGTAQIRRCVIDVLIKRRPDRLLDLLTLALSNREPNVQLSAIHGLWRVGDRKAIVLLQPIAANRQHPYSRDARRAIESFESLQPAELTLVRASEPPKNANHLLRSTTGVQESHAGLLLRPTANTQDIE